MQDTPLWPPVSVSNNFESFSAWQFELWQSNELLAFSWLFNFKDGILEFSFNGYGQQQLLNGHSLFAPPRLWFSLLWNLNFSWVNHCFHFWWIKWKSRVVLLFQWLNNYRKWLRWAVTFWIETSRWPMDLHYRMVFLLVNHQLSNCWLGACLRRFSAKKGLA